MVQSVAPLVDTFTVPVSFSTYFSNCKFWKKLGNIHFTNWRHDRVFSHQQVKGFHSQAKLFNFGGFNAVRMLLQIFEIIFPHDLIKSVIIKEANLIPKTKGVSTVLRTIGTLSYTILESTS